MYYIYIYMYMYMYVLCMCVNIYIHIYIYVCVCVFVHVQNIKKAKTKLLLLFILGLFMNDLCILVCLHSCHKLMCQKFALALHGISTIWRTVFSSSCNANSLGFEGFT